MLELSSWVERLRDADLGVEIALAADVQAAQGGSRRLPSITLVPGQERVTQQPRHPRPHHKVSAETMIITGVPRYGRAEFGEGGDQLSALRQPVLMSLIGWQPPGAELGIIWRGGRLLTLSDNALYWIDIVAADYWWRTTNGENTP